MYIYHRVYVFFYFILKKTLIHIPFFQIKTKKKTNILFTETLTWTILPATGAAPTVRDFCSMCSFTVDNNSYLAVFGGANENEETNVIIHFNDLHLYDLGE